MSSSRTFIIYWKHGQTLIPKIPNHLIEFIHLKRIALIRGHKLIYWWLQTRNRKVRGSTTFAMSLVYRSQKAKRFCYKSVQTPVNLHKGTTLLHRRIFLMGVAGAITGCTSGYAHRLNVYNWDNYVAKSTVPDFEHRFNCTVRYAVYGSAEEMLAKIMSGNSGWDVVFPSNSFVGPMRELGLLARLDHNRLPNLRHLDPQFQSPEWDPHLEWCVPYMHSATGILYSKRVSPPPLRWADLWTGSYGHRITMLDDPAEVFAACLKRLGDSVNTADERQLKAARDLAIQQKPLLRAYLNEEVRDQVVAGDVLAAQMWAQVAQVAMDNSSDLAFAFPQEGFPLYADNICILRESKHHELAYEWVNYLLEPQVAATIATEITAATANTAARRLLPAKLQNNPVLYLDHETRGHGEWFRALPPAVQRLRDRYWTEIKSA